MTISSPVSPHGSPDPLRTAHIRSEVTRGVKRGDPARRWDLLEGFWLDPSHRRILSGARVAYLLGPPGGPLLTMTFTGASGSTSTPTAGSCAATVPAGTA